MAQPLNTDTAPHYAWGDGCDGWHLCQTDALSVIEERMPPGARETRHAHARAQQVFYVLDGVLDLELNGLAHRLGARQALEVAAGAPHQAVNRSDAYVRFLVISTPPAQGDRVPVAEARA